MLMENGSVAGGWTSSRTGFRLQDATDALETGSIYSMCKQRIDRLFDSDSPAASSPTSNCVQAKIEQMFSEVATVTQTAPPIPPPLPPPPNVAAPPPSHNFSVHYLGSVPLEGKVSSLAGLQKPLRDLYFNDWNVSSLTSRLEISHQGLRVQYETEQGDREHINTFPSIAVWSAVKFVLDEERTSFAFLPLVTDPENIDKCSFFQPLQAFEIDTLEKGDLTNSPLFAVVMRTSGLPKCLECHGFICQTSEDAIVIAATLYKSLMFHMSNRNHTPRRRNGIVSCMSVISSSTAHDKTTTPSTPIRPPRSKKRSTCSSRTSIADDTNSLKSDTPIKRVPVKRRSTKKRRAPAAPPSQPSGSKSSTQPDFDAIVSYEEPIPPIPQRSMSEKLASYMTKEQRQLTAEIVEKLRSGEGPQLRPVSGVTTAAESRHKPTEGDIFTKVTIPRSGSFLNTAGLARYKSKNSRNGQSSGGSPLGFHELFNEFRLQEGLNSLDEILAAIIHPEGMSFNDLKPIYKEFLLKLSVTLTKDELYQRSKAIMKRHRKKKKKKKMVSPNKRKMNGSVSSSGTTPRRSATYHIFNLKRAFSASHYRPVSRKGRHGQATAAHGTASAVATCEDTCSAGSSGDSTAYAARRAHGSAGGDCFTMRRRRRRRQRRKTDAAVQHRNSSSGYVSCSECSFDSDSCACTSVDKCYCSLRHRTVTGDARRTCGAAANGAGSRKTAASLACDTTVYCGCDTDSCAESNKCYCSRNSTSSKNTNTAKTTNSLEYVANPVRPQHSFPCMARSQPSHWRKGIPAHAEHRSLTAKKSAEIAALFADIKLGGRGAVGGGSVSGGSQRILIAGNTGLYNNSNSMYNSRNGLYTIQSQSDDSVGSLGGGGRSGGGGGGGGDDKMNNACALGSLQTGGRRPATIPADGVVSHHRPINRHHKHNLESTLGYFP